MKNILYKTVYILQLLIFTLIRELIMLYTKDPRLVIRCQHTEFRHYFTWEEKAMKLFYLLPWIALGYAIHDNYYVGVLFFTGFSIIVSVMRVIEFFIPKAIN